MNTLHPRFLLLIIVPAFIIPLTVLLLPVQRFFSFLPLFSGLLTWPIGATLGGIATPLLLLAGTLVLLAAAREHQQTSQVQQGALASDREKIHAEVATRYILELFALFKQENDKFSPEEVQNALKTIADTHQNYHDGQVPPLIFNSHLRYTLNTSAVGQHLQHIAQLLTHLIKVVRSKEGVLLPEDYDLVISFLTGFNTAIYPKLKALVQHNNTCDLCHTNPFDYFGGKDQVGPLNKALESINIKPYKF